MYQVGAGHVTSSRVSLLFQPVGFVYSHVNFVDCTFTWPYFVLYLTTRAWADKMSLYPARVAPEKALNHIFVILSIVSWMEHFPNARFIFESPADYLVPN